MRHPSIHGQAKFLVVNFRSFLFTYPMVKPTYNQTQSDYFLFSLSCVCICLNCNNMPDFYSLVALSILCHVVRVMILQLIQVTLFSNNLQWLPVLFWIQGLLLLAREILFVVVFTSLPYHLPFTISASAAMAYFQFPKHCGLIPISIPLCLLPGTHFPWSL